MSIDQAEVDLVVDCHMHVYDLLRYPLEQRDSVSPPSANWQQYQIMARQVGITHTVIVQPVGYGFDNRCTLDALAQQPERTRAIVCIAPGTESIEWAQMDRLGVKGVRFMLIPGGGGLLRWQDMQDFSGLIADYDWTLNLQLDGRSLPEFERQIAAQPCKIVIDHCAKFLTPVPPTHPGVDTLRRLLDSGKVWVKLSAPYETSLSGAPDYEDVGVIARLLAAEYPERCLWASNWPHPTQQVRPDDSNLLRLLRQWVGNEQHVHQILWTNPSRLYGFN